MTINGIIFDMDGLLIDSESLYIRVQHELAQSFGHEFSEDILQKMMGQKPIDAMKIFCDELKIDRSVEELLDMRTDRMIELFENELKAMPGMVESVRRLYRVVPLGLATGSDSKLMNIALHRFNIDKYFEVKACADEVRKGKPDPELYSLVATRMGVNPKRLVALEDSENGCVSAVRAGLTVIAIPSPYSQTQDFSVAWRQFSNLIEAADLLETLILS